MIHLVCIYRGNGPFRNRLLAQTLIKSFNELYQVALNEPCSFHPSIFSLIPMILFHCTLVFAGFSALIRFTLIDRQSLLCTRHRGIETGFCPSYGRRCWGVNRAGVGVVVDGGWRSTSLRERDCLAREEPRRREECRSTRALSLRVTFLL